MATGLKARSRQQSNKVRVSVTPFQERFERLKKTGEITTNLFARNMGFFNDRPYNDKHVKQGKTVDTSRALRCIGLQPSSSKAGKHYYTQTVGEEMAIRLCDALYMDYWEVGI